MRMGHRKDVREFNNRVIEGGGCLTALHEQNIPLSKRDGDGVHPLASELHVQQNHRLY